MTRSHETCIEILREVRVYKLACSDILQGGASGTCIWPCEPPLGSYPTAGIVQFVCVCVCFPTGCLSLRAVYQGEDLFAPSSDLIVSVSVILRRAEDTIRKAISNFHLLAMRGQRLYIVSPLLSPLHFYFFFVVFLFESIESSTSKPTTPWPFFFP